MVSAPIKEKRKIAIFDELILKSWWTILFVFLAFFAYEQATQRREEEENKLINKKHSIEIAIKEASILQQELIMHLNSMEDVNSIELMLMQKMGLVPEGKVKVFLEKGNL